MADQNDQGVVKPEVVMLETLLDDIAAGRLRVPRFQRPFVWEREQMLELFDSIERGYPIGSILTWETSAHIPSLDIVAGIDVPPPAEGAVSYLLDGHQRLSTLFGTLGRRPAPVDAGEDSIWRIYRELGDQDKAGVRFRHWPDGGQPPSTLLPLQAVLRTMDFLGYARRLTRDAANADDADALIDEAERLAQQIKSYKIALIRLVGGSLSHAVEAFARLNSGGRQITPQDMVSALTYRPENGESLSDRINTIQRGIASSGFGPLPTELIFQTVVALSDDRDPAKIRWSEFAVGVGDRLDEYVARADVALARTVQFLRYEAGVSIAALLPYPLQMVLLAVFLDRHPHLQREQTRALVRWFWSTSWSGVLRSASGPEFWPNLMAMRFGDPIHPLYDVHGRDMVGRPQPFPDDFDTDRGRTRAYLLWELREFSHRLGIDGEVIDAVDLYTRSGPAAFRPAAERYLVRQTANQVMLPIPPGVSVEQALRALPARQLRDLMVSHGIPAEAMAHLLGGDAAAFVATRASFLAERERAFMQEMGVEPPPVNGYEADEADEG